MAQSPYNQLPGGFPPAFNQYPSHPALAYYAASLAAMQQGGFPFSPSTSSSSGSLQYPTASPGYASPSPAQVQTPFGMTATHPLPPPLFGSPTAASSTSATTPKATRTTSGGKKQTASKKRKKAEQESTSTPSPPARTVVSPPSVPVTRSAAQAMQLQLPDPSTSAAPTQEDDAADDDLYVSISHDVGGNKGEGSSSTGHSNSSSTAASS